MDFNFNDIKSGKKNNLSDLFIDEEAIQRLFSAFFGSNINEYLKFSSDYSRCILPRWNGISMYVKRDDFYAKNPNEFYKDLNELIPLKMEIEGCPIEPYLSIGPFQRNEFIIDFLKAFKRIDSIDLESIRGLNKKEGKDFEEILQKTKYTIFRKPSNDKIKWHFVIKSEYCIVRLRDFVIMPSTQFFGGIASKHIIIDVSKLPKHVGKINTYEKHIEWIISLITNPNAEITIVKDSPASEYFDSDGQKWLNEYVNALSKKLNKIIMIY